MDGKPRWCAGEVAEFVGCGSALHVFFDEVGEELLTSKAIEFGRELFPGPAEDKWKPCPNCTGPKPDPRQPCGECEGARRVPCGLATLEA